MRGLLPFLAHRLFRALIALWLVSTVVFVVMRLSGDPVPLLLPPDAPTQRDLARAARPGPRPVAARAVRRLPRQHPARRLRPVHPLPRARLHRGAGLPRRHARAGPDRLRPRHPDRAAHRAPLGDEAQLAARPRGHGRGPRRPVGADVLPRHPVHPAAVPQGRSLPDLRPRRLEEPRAARAHPRRLHHGLDRAAHALRRARGAGRRLHPHGARQGRGRDVRWWPSTRSRTPPSRS